MLKKSFRPIMPFNKIFPLNSLHIQYNKMEKNSSTFLNVTQNQQNFEFRRNRKKEEKTETK